MNTKKNKFHSILAKYFANQPLFLGNDNRDKPNKRKCAEQPWHQAKAEMWDEVSETLCDLEFIEAKVAANMVAALQLDYIRLFSFSTQLNSKMLNNLENYYQFIKFNAHRFRRFGSINGFVHQQAYNYPKSKHIASASSRILNALPNPSFLLPNQKDKGAKLQSRILEAPEHRPLNKVAFIADAEILAISRGFHVTYPSEDLNEMYVWELSTGSLRQIFKPPKLDSTAAPFLIRSALWGAEKSWHSTAMSIDPVWWVTVNYVNHSGQVELWEAANPVPIHVYSTSFLIKIGSLCISKDCLYLSFEERSSFDDNSKIHIYKIEIAQKNVEPILSFSTEPTTALAIASIPGWLVTGHLFNGFLRIWDIKSGALLYELKAHSKTITEVDVALDGSRIISASHDGSVHLWEPFSKTKSNIYSGHAGDVYGVALSKDYNIAVSCGEDGTVRVWELELERHDTVTWDQAGAVGAALISSDGKTGFISKANVVYKWKIPSLKKKAIYKASSFVTEMSFINDSIKINTGYREKPVVLDLVTSEVFPFQEESFTKSLPKDVQLIALPNKARLISFSDSYSEWQGHKTLVGVWNRNSANNEMNLMFDRLHGVHLFSHGNAIAGIIENRATVIGIHPIKQLWISEDYATHVFPSPTGFEVVTIKINRSHTTIRKYDLLTGKTVTFEDRDIVEFDLQGNTRHPIFQILPDGMRLAGFGRSYVKLWDLETGKTLAVFDIDREQIRTVTSSRPDGLWLIGTQQGNILLLKCRNAIAAHPLVAALRRWQNGQWDLKYSTLCPWCGETIIVNDMLEGYLISSMNFNFLEMHQERWDDSILIEACSYCEHELKFVPVVNDNSSDKRFGSS